MWRVTFKSDTPKGDILVRKGVSLESDEVGCILFGSLVQQSGPQETLEDGIIRMPIVWDDPEGKGRRQGWVTCDASSQGGPKFFNAAPDEPLPEPAKPLPAEATDRQNASASGGSAPAASERRSGGEKSGGGDGFATTWDKNRMWRVTNLEPSANRDLPLLSRADPYAPGTGRVPPAELVVRWLSNEEVVEQIGHSKKTRGYMVMPVRVLRDAQGEAVKDVEGWVTRRLVDKQRDGADTAWLVEIRDENEANQREKRRSERKEKRGEKATES
jgi:hypothetical protein